MARLNLSFLGSPTILLNGVEVHIRRAKVLGLLAYLAITGQPVTRDIIAAILWPRDTPKDAYTYLRQTLWHLNKLLGKEWLLIEGERISLQWQTELWVDVQIYQQRLRLLTTQPDNGRFTAMIAAADLYQGELLAGFTMDDSPEFEAWQLMERTALHHTQRALLSTLVEQLQQAQNYLQAITYGRQLLKLDPVNEAAHRQLMTLYTLTGQQALALRQYQECVNLLAQELGVPPDETTTALHAAILDKRLPPFQPTTPPIVNLPVAPPTSAAAQPSGHTVVAVATVAPTPQPPATAVATPVAALPTPITPFIGREHELLQIQTLLNDPDCRLLTLIGSGGIGKTRLALAATQRILDFVVSAQSNDFRFLILDSTPLQAIENPKSKIQNPHFPDGVFFVPLADVVTPDRLAMTIAGVVQFTLYRRDEEPLQQLIHYLADKRLLLVLDNFEHLVAGAPQLTALLAQAPGVKVLTTSRERLNVQGEWLLEVTGLLYNQEAPLHQMADYSAVQLFVQCARRANSTFMLDETNKGAVARICSLVEGLPLALELAATWLRHLPCQEIVTELEQSLTMLTASQRDLPLRHRSVRALFDYSWSLLSEEERAVVERLSIFRGGFRREAARAVADAPLPIVMALVDKSLLRSDSTGRFSMHELVRQFAADGLNAQPFAAEGVAQRHFTYYTTWLQQQRGQLHGKAQKRVLGEILAELENVRAAWRRALQQHHLPAITAALDTLADVHELCGWFHEGEAVFQEAVTAFTQAADEQQRRLWERLWGRLQARLAFFAQRLAKYSSARQLLQEAYAKLQALGDLTATSYCLNCLGETARISGDYEEAERCLTESITLCRTHGDQQLLSRAYSLLGIVYGVRGRLEEAQRLFRDSLTLSEMSEDQLGIAKTLNNLGILAYFAGDYSTAQSFYQRSLNINQDLGHQYDTALALSNLGLVAQKQGRFADAIAIFEESIAIHRKIGYELGVGRSLRCLCITLLDLQQLDEAAIHLQEVLHLAQKIRNLPLGLAGLVGLAQLFALRDDWATVVRLAAFIHHHPATEDEIRTKAADLLVAAQSHWPTMPSVAIDGATPDDDPWQIVAAFIGNASTLA